jgi:hypothetical protein
MANNRDDFKKYLPADLLDHAISFEKTGIYEYSWGWQDAIKVIDVLIQKGIFILGGDVYHFVDDKYKPTYDNWYVDPSNLIVDNEELQKSGDIAKKFINSYVEQHGEGFYFVIVARFPKKK